MKYLLFLWLCTSVVAMAQPSTTESYNPKHYIGSTQFFDISGQWINESTDTTRRLASMNIRTTIVNTYRAVPFFSLNGLTFPTDEVQLVISEREMAYITNILEAKCMVMPIIENNEQKLRVYSIIVNAAGAWLGVATDVLVRKKNDIAANSSNDTISPHTTANMPPLAMRDLVGYWLNEWEENTIIPKVQIFTNPEGKIVFKVFRMVSEKAKPVGEFLVKSETPQRTQIVEWRDGELKTTFYFRPIILSNKLMGFDLLVEEIYMDGSPRSIFRQFLTKDPDSKRIMESENLIARLEGEWINTDFKSPTKKLTIYDGDIELFNVSSETTNGIQSLGKQTLRPSEANLLGTTIPNLFSLRKLEVDINLKINQQYFKDAPAVMVITTTIEDRAGEKEPYMYTEVFRRKNTTISRQMLGIQ